MRTPCASANDELRAIDWACITDVADLLQLFAFISYVAPAIFLIVAQQCRYVPGAGDDEETWAQGLTAAGFWQHWQPLCSGGPAGLDDRIRVVNAAAREVTISADPLQVVDSTSLRRVVPTDLHHPAPEGCRNSNNGKATHQAAPGVFALVGLPLLIGSRAAVDALGGRLWRWTQTVLMLSSGQPAPCDGLALAAEMPAAAACATASGVDNSLVVRRVCAIPIRDSKLARRDLLTQLPEALNVIAASLQGSRRPVLLVDDGADPI